MKASVAYVGPVTALTYGPWLAVEAAVPGASLHPVPVGFAACVAVAVALAAAHPRVVRTFAA